MGKESDIHVDRAGALMREITERTGKPVYLTYVSDKCTVTSGDQTVERRYVGEALTALVIDAKTHDIPARVKSAIWELRVAADNLARLVEAP